MRGDAARVCVKFKIGNAGIQKKKNSEYLEINEIEREFMSKWLFRFHKLFKMESYLDSSCFYVCEMCRFERHL